MADYVYKNDGKVHTRYSELLRCTPKQIARVMAERYNERNRYEGSSMVFGTNRHEMWAEESQKTGFVPECFFEVDVMELSVDHVEEEFAIEILPNFVVHMRPDAVSSKVQTIVDYKTAVIPEGVTLEAFRYKIRRTYELSKQLKFYAWLLGYHGIRIKNGVYLIEIWNHERTEIVGYAMAKQVYTLADFANMLTWLTPRATLLAAAIEKRLEGDEVKLMEIDTPF